MSGIRNLTGVAALLGALLTGSEAQAQDPNCAFADVDIWICQLNSVNTCSATCPSNNPECPVATAQQFCTPSLDDFSSCSWLVFESSRCICNDGDGPEYAAVDRCQASPECTADGDCVSHASCTPLGTCVCNAGYHEHANGVCHANSAHPAGFCNSSHPCPSGQTCKNSTRRCETPVTCSPSCGNNQTCRSGTCACNDGYHRHGSNCYRDHPSGFCNTQHPCPSGQTCNDSFRCEVPPPTCSPTCGTDAQCINGSCVCESGHHDHQGSTTCHDLDCTGDAACGTNETCNKAGHCLCKSGFHWDTHRGPCHANHADGFCNSHHSCPTGKVCESSACVDPPATCSPSCASDETCDDGTCVCTDGSEHKHGGSCHDTECNVTADCSSGETCNAGHCQCSDTDEHKHGVKACHAPGCHADTDCSGGKLCDTAAETCACPSKTRAHDNWECHTESTGHCHTNTECTAAGTTCVDWSCECEPGKHKHGNTCHANHPVCPENSEETTHTATERVCSCEDGYLDTNPNDNQLVCIELKVEDEGCSTGQHAHGETCHANHPACPANSAETTHTETQRVCSCKDGYEDTNPVDNQLVCTEAASDGCSTGQHAHGETCHANHPACPANSEETTHTATLRICSCKDGYEDTNPGDHQVVCTEIPDEGCSSDQHAHGDTCHANHPPCPANSTESAHKATERICRCNSGWEDQDPSEAVQCARPVCESAFKTKVCRCPDGTHVHDPSDGGEGVLSILCHAEDLTHPDPGCASSGGTWDHATCICPEGMVLSANKESCECPDDSEGSVLVPRVSVLHPNPQSLFDGLQVGFVNTSAGNLTFRRRDLVTRAQGPVIFARVYDSRIAANDDFGPGWRLSLAEELLIDGDRVTYVDDAGTRRGFAWSAHGYAASPPTPRHAATTLRFEDVDGIRRATMVDGTTTRTFEKADAAGTRYAVKTVTTRARELAFDYEGGRLASVSHDGSILLRVERGADGRIAAVRDNHRRSVSYSYSDGRLETVRDLAGSDWRYLYRDDGLLGGAVDPDDRPYLAASFDETERVTRSYSGPIYTFDYGLTATTVTEGAGDVHTFERIPTGVTTALSSTAGASWRLTVDSANRVTALTLPERSFAYTYDGEGRVETIAETDDGITTTRLHEYDAQGRLTAVTGGPEPVTVTYVRDNVHIRTGDHVFEYDLDERGRVVAVRDGGGDTVRAERDVSGDIVGVSRGDRVVRLGRDELGRVTLATFPDGEFARHSYYGNGTLAEYPTGVSTPHDYGTSNPIGAVEKDGGRGSRTMGRVAEFNAGGASIAVQHDPQRTLAAVTGTKASREWKPPTTKDNPKLAHTDLLRAWLLEEQSTQVQPRYGPVVLNTDSQFVTQDHLAIGVPWLRASRRLRQGSALVVGSRFTGPLGLLTHRPELRVIGVTESAAPKVARVCQFRFCKPVWAFSDFKSCARVVQAVDPTRQSSINGCSTPVATPYRSLFEPACEIHDACYNRCKSGQDACDGEFGRNLHLLCRKALFPAACRPVANSYFAAVVLKGESRYEDAQVEHCHCC